MSDFEVAMTALAWLGAYLAPAIIAAVRRHHNVGPIAVVNVLLGWTIIGWIVALAMSLSRVQKAEAPVT